jgi:endonuclease/exonuclease/phosphatase family metal-dependent hydrolase
MKTITFFLILSFAFFNTAIAQNVNLMTFNIRYNNESDGINKWENRKDRAAEMLKFYDISICGMQEALIGQINDLKERLPEYTHFGLGRDDGKEKGEFSPIFYNTSKLKVLKQETFWLSETPDKPSKGWDANLPRIVTWGYFLDLKTKKKFYVFNTHYDHIGKIARAESSKLLLKKIKEIAGENPVFLMGDFNATPSDEPIKIIAETLFETSALSQTPHFGPESTFNGFKSNEQDNRKIDHIFVNNKNIKVLKHATLSNTWAGLFASDHHPVMTSVSLNNK